MENNDEFSNILPRAANTSHKITRSVTLKNCLSKHNGPNKVAWCISSKMKEVQESQVHSTHTHTINVQVPSIPNKSNYGVPGNDTVKDLVNWMPSIPINQDDGEMVQNTVKYPIWMPSTPTKYGGATVHDTVRDSGRGGIPQGMNEVQMINVKVKIDNWERMMKDRKSKFSQIDSKNEVKKKATEKGWKSRKLRKLEEAKNANKNQLNTRQMLERMNAMKVAEKSENEDPG